LAGALWNVELALGARPWRFAIPTAFMVLGLLGAHAIQAHRAARLGKIGLGLSVLGLALTVTGTITMPAKRGEAIGGPEAVSLLGFAFLVLGLVLFGIATLRARVLPRWSRPLPLFMALSLTGSMPTLGILPPAQLFGYGWMLFGLAL